MKEDDMLAERRENVSLEPLTIRIQWEDLENLIASLRKSKVLGLKYEFTINGITDKDFIKVTLVKI